MNRSIQSVSSILTQAALFAVILTVAHSQNAAPVLVAKFVGNISTKSGKVGDAVVAKTEKPAKTADGRDIPKGSQITGKVVAVHSRKAGSGDSMLAIKFDQIETKGAKLPIEGQIMAIGHSSGSEQSDNSYLGIGNSAPTLTVDPLARTIAKSDGSDDGLGIAVGSTLPGVTLALHLNDSGATELNGYKRDIKLDSAVLVKVKLN